MIDDPNEAVLTDPWRIVVELDDDNGSSRNSYGYFATRQDALDFAMRNRVRLGLHQCLSWSVENIDE